METGQPLTVDLQACLEAFEGEPSGLANAVAHLLPAQRPTPSDVARLFCRGDASQAKHVQKRHRLGSILAASYAVPNAWPDGDPGAAIAALDALLNDERFQRDASVQILSSAERPGADRLRQAPLWENAAWPNLENRAQRVNANFLAGVR